MTKIQELREAIVDRVSWAYYDGDHQSESEGTRKARSAIAAILDTPAGRDGLRRELEGEAAKPMIPAHTAQRIGYLHNPLAIDALLDEFQNMGLPMGSDTWAEQALLYVKELVERNHRLHQIEARLSDIKNDVHDFAGLYREQRKKVVEESLKRIAQREGEGRPLPAGPSTKGE